MCSSFLGKSDEKWLKYPNLFLQKSIDSMSFPLHYFPSGRFFAKKLLFLGMLLVLSTTVVHAKTGMAKRDEINCLEKRAEVLSHMIRQDAFRKACDEMEQQLSKDNLYSQEKDEAKRAEMRWRVLKQRIEKEQNSAVINEFFRFITWFVPSFRTIRTLLAKILVVVLGGVFCYALCKLDLKYTPKIARFLYVPTIYDKTNKFVKTDLYKEVGKEEHEWTIMRLLATYALKVKFPEKKKKKEKKEKKEKEKEKEKKEDRENLENNNSIDLIQNTEEDIVTNEKVEEKISKEIERRSKKNEQQLQAMVSNTSSSTILSGLVYSIIYHLVILIIFPAWDYFFRFLSLIQAYFGVITFDHYLSDPFEKQQEFFIKELYPVLPLKCKQYLYEHFRNSYAELAFRPKASPRIVIALQQKMNLLTSNYSPKLHILSDEELDELTKPYIGAEEMKKKLKHMFRQIKRLNDSKKKKGKVPKTSQRVILWLQGPPGTGKTYLMTNLLEKMNIDFTVVNNHHDIARNAISSSGSINEFKAILGDDMDSSLNLYTPGQTAQDGFTLALLNPNELYLSKRIDGETIMFRAADFTGVTANHPLRAPAAKDRVNYHFDVNGTTLDAQYGIGLSYLESLTKDYDSGCTMEDFTEEELGQIESFVKQKSEPTMRSLTRFVDTIYADKLDEKERLKYQQQSQSSVANAVAFTDVDASSNKPLKINNEITTVRPSPHLPIAAILMILLCLLLVVGATWYLRRSNKL
ncbi:MAG: hypothetical protein ACPGC9_01015 [Cytophagales bacterium]